MTSIGVSYFTISHDGHPCPLCGPWEGAILTAGGYTGLVAEQAADDGRPVAFTVKATLDEARAAGLWHPNCRHTLLPYFPGVTKTSSSSWTTADAARYQATQRLRHLERRVRALKREQAGALDQVAAKRAGRKIRAAQAEIRAHVARHGLVRRTRREQPHLGHK